MYTCTVCRKLLITTVSSLDMYTLPTVLTLPDIPYCMYDPGESMLLGAVGRLGSLDFGALSQNWEGASRMELVIGHRPARGILTCTLLPCTVYGGES